MPSPAPIWVLHKIWAGGSSARALFFTRDQGLIWAKYHGGWSPKKQALLQAFTPLWVDFQQRHQWYYVRHLELLGLPFELTTPALFSALYLNELLLHGMQVQDPHPDLYDAYVMTLQHLSLSQSHQEIEQVLRRFEWKLLVSLGYAISLTHDAQYSTPIAADQYYQFQADQGFFPAASGLLGADILAVARDELSEMHVLKIAKYIMRRALNHALGGKKIKSRELFRTAHSRRQ